MRQHTPAPTEELSQLAFGQLDDGAREKLVNALLSNADAAREVKLALRLRDGATAIASDIVRRASEQRVEPERWTLRLFAGAAALGITMLVFSPMLRTPAPSVQSVAAVAGPDEVIMSATGFEADGSFGGSFE
jgi:hypothetical protein